MDLSTSRVLRYRGPLGVAPNRRARRNCADGRQADHPSRGTGGQPGWHAAWQQAGPIACKVREFAEAMRRGEWRDNLLCRARLQGKTRWQLRIRTTGFVQLPLA